MLGKAALERFEEGLKRFHRTTHHIIDDGNSWLCILLWRLWYIYRLDRGLTPEEFMQFVMVLGIAFTVYTVFAIFFKHIRNLIATKISAPLVTRLIDRNEIRQQALVICAVLFTLGFLIQVAMLFLDA